MLRTNFCIASLLAAGAILMACSDSGSAPSENARTIYGMSQKGPFVKGTEVTLYGMNENLLQSGTHFSTTITNDQGGYTLKNVELENRYAWLNANGYYIDEITGDSSAQKISLNSLVDFQGRDHANINILTHLSFDLIRHLVKNGKAVDEAKREAEKEVLAAFGFADGGESFDQLDIQGSGEGDAKLLAVSLIMLTAEDMATVTERMASLALDLESDGVLDDSTLIGQMKKDVSMASHDAVYKKVRENLMNMGFANVAEFQKYVEQFAAPWDSTWGTWVRCGSQDEVRDGRICRNGVWKSYFGPRADGDSPVDTAGKYGSLVDNRDDKVYKTLDIEMNDGATVTWMVSNLAYEPAMDEGLGYAYGICQVLNAPDKETCSSETFRSEIREKISHKENVQGICPEGWHLPQSHDWEKLNEASDGDYRIRELFEYLHYNETEKMYGVAHIGNELVLDEADDLFGPADERFPDFVVPYEVRCVKN